MDGHRQQASSVAVKTSLTRGRCLKVRPDGMYLVSTTTEVPVVATDLDRRQ